ncbi:MAG: hypothetical protein H6Q74_760 [Firmicutes bacterium]|nr:hypothetical protein [Bacillota bacterium]
MNLKQLEYFISVAEYLNFTKAAQHHYIAQTAISHQIIALEKELGIPLFYRNKRTVKLTNAGEVFYNEVKTIVTKLENAVNTTLLANANAQGNLTLGFYGLVGKDYFPHWLRNFLFAYPNINLKLVNNTNNLQDLLHNGKVDILFQFSHALNIDPKFSWENICVAFADPLCAVVPCDHPLAKKATIHRSDLANEPFVFFDQKSNPSGFESIVNDCNNTGVSPKIVAQASSAETLLVLVEAKLGITVLPSCYKNQASPAIRFIDLEEDYDRVTSLIAVWRTNNSNPIIPLFLNMIKSQPPCDLLAPQETG